jgi:hypothetical protein
MTTTATDHPFDDILFDVVVPQLPYLILEVELPLPHVPCVLATFERIRQSHPFPAPMQRGDAPSGRLVFGEELVGHAAHAGRVARPKPDEKIPREPGGTDVA